MEQKTLKKFPSLPHYQPLPWIQLHDTLAHVVGFTAKARCLLQEDLPRECLTDIIPCKLY